MHTGHIVTLKKQRLREHELVLVALLFFARRLALLDFTFLSIPFLDCFLYSFLGDVGIRTCLGLSGDIASLLRDWLLAASETLNLASSSKTWRKCSQGRQAVICFVMSQNLRVPGACSGGCGKLGRRLAKEFLVLEGGGIFKLRFWFLESSSVMG